LTGSIPVDGELLAAPFVAGGVLLVTLGLQRLNTLAAAGISSAGLRPAARRIGTGTLSALHAARPRNLMHAAAPLHARIAS